MVKEEVDLLNIETIRQIQLRLLDNLDSFCKKNNLRYSLGGGSLLGAVRHKGYIPWDDDIDIMMPRPDYNYFITHFNDNYVKNIRCYAFENDETWKFPFAKICDLDTLLIQETSINLGINIDLFPVDGIPKKNCLFMVKLKILRYALFSHISTRSHKFPKSLLVSLAKRFVKIQRIQRMIKRTCEKNVFGYTKYAGSVLGVYGRKEIYPTDYFLTYEEMLFEGKKYFCISNYDAYLKQHYGNYLELPPEEKRIHPHSIKAIRV